jgi:TonB-dependent receptor
MNDRISKRSLSYGVAMMAALTLNMGQAWAAEAPAAAPSSDTSPAGDIVVTGARKAQRAAIDEKARSLTIKDSITQDDIGRLPDTTVVEAARRIPGVSVNLLTDNNRGRSEVQRATIRGFDAKYNLVTIDGSEIASIDTAALSSGSITRAFNLNLLPASLMSRLDVVKSVTAEYDPQALGGQIDMVTRSAFDSKKPFYANISAMGGLDTSSGGSISGRHPSERLSAIVSDRFDLGGSRLGLTLAADYQNTWSSSNGSTVGVPGATNQNNAGWTYYDANGRSVAGPAQSTSGAVPTRFQAYSFDDHLEHWSVSGKAEFETDGGFKSSLFAGYYGSTSTETRYEDLVTRSASQIAGTGATGTGAPTNQTATTGRYAINDVEIGLTYQPIKQSTLILNWKNHLDLSDSLKLDLDAAYSRATGHLYRNMIKYSANNSVASSGSVSAVTTPAISGGYNSSGFVPTLQFDNPGLLTASSTYSSTYFRYIDFNETNNIVDLHPTLSWNAGPRDHGLGLRAGLRFTQNKTGYGEHYVEYDPKTPTQFNLSNASSLTQSIPSWGTSVPVIDRSAANAILSSNLSSFTAIDETTANNANGFSFREQTGAAFLQAVYNGGPFKAQAGLRRERTWNQIENLQQVSNGTYAPVSANSHYDAWLPSVLASYAIRDNLIAHAAFTETLGRPDQSAYGPLAKVGQPANGQIAITLGNAAIKPRRTTNYDAALDLYFDNHHSLLSLQYYHKDLRDEFYNRAYSANYSYAGTTYVGNFTQVTNGGSAHVDGLEINLQKDRLPILPERFGALGMSANVTKMWTKFTILDSTGATRQLDNLVNQPDYIANASLFYTYGKFQLAFSANAQGKTLFQTGLYTWQDTYVLARHQFDLTARYELRPNVTLLFEGSNLTGERFRSAMGPHQELAADDYNIGTQLWAGVTMKF